jgi:hypothetical protein
MRAVFSMPHTAIVEGRLAAVPVGSVHRKLVELY